MNRKYRDRSQAIYLGSSLDAHRDADHNVTYCTGYVATLDGYVTLYSQGYDGRYSRHTSLRFIYEGREYVRDVDATFTTRGLATIARRFAREVVLVLSQS